MKMFLPYDKRIAFFRLCVALRRGECQRPILRCLLRTTRPSYCGNEILE